ncbi:unnamed protein product [Closterium sp. NIES-53]
MDVWGPARVIGQGRERYFLFVVDHYTRYTMAFPLHSKGQVFDVLIPWICAVRLQLRERFYQDLPILRLHSDRGGEFSSDLLRDFCRGEGILQSFMLPDSPQQNGIAERCISLVMENPRSHCVGRGRLAMRRCSWSGDLVPLFAIRPRTSSQTRAIPCVFLGFPPDALGWQIYYPTLRRVFPSQDGTFDKLVPFYRLFPYRSAPPLLPPLFLAPGATWGAASGGAERGGAEPRGAESEGARSRGAEPGDAETWGAKLRDAESGGAEPRGFGVIAGAGGTGGAAAAGPRGARTRLTKGAGTGGVGGAGAGDPTEPDAAESGGTGAGGPGAGGAQAGGAGADGTGAGGTGAGDAGAGGAGAVHSGAGGARARAAGGISVGGTVRPRCTSFPCLSSQPPHCLLLLLTQSTLVALPIVVSLRLVLPPLFALVVALLVRVLLLSPAHTLWHFSDRARAASPTVSRLLSSVVTDPCFESTAASALVAELVDFAAACRVDYATALVAESESPSPPSVGGECALGTDMHEDFECLAVAVPRFASMLLAPAGHPDAPDIPTSRSYAEAITGTYVDAVPLSRANIVDGMWIFRVKQPPGSLPAFEARYIAQGFSQRQGVHFFQNFSPTPKMTTLRVLLHVAAQRDYELHSLNFSAAFLQGSLDEEIWLHRPPGFTGSFLVGIWLSLWRPVYGLRQAPREWHDTLRTTLAALRFTSSTADPSLFPRTHTSLPSFYVLVPSCKRDTPALTWVLQRFGFQFSSPQPNPLSTGHSLSAPPLDESVEPSGPYLELVGCLMYLMTCRRPDLAYPFSLLARYVAPGRHRKVHWDAAKRVLRYLCSTSGMGLVLGGWGPVVLTGHADASWVDDSSTEQSSQGYTFSLGSGSVSWRSTRSSSVLSSICEAEIYAGAMAAQELRWLTYLLADLGEQPRSPPVLYVDNKAMIAL